MTAVGATQQTNLRFYAGGDAVPGTANLNPSPGAAPTPNAVNIPLDEESGEFGVYNRFGTVRVFIDVMGYYDDHTHHDRYSTEDEVDEAFESAGGVGWEFDGNIRTLSAEYQVLEQLTFTLPTDGYVVLTGSLALDTGSSAGVRCAIGPADINPQFSNYLEFDGGENYSATRGYGIPAGMWTVYLICRVESGAASIANASLTLTFSPNRL